MPIVMNVFDSNIITGARTALEFETTTPAAEGSLGGVIDSLLWNDFASSDGSLASQALDVVPVYGGPVPYIDEINDTWQDYFNQPDTFRLFGGQGDHPE
jgi:hypothetical protein